MSTHWSLLSTPLLEVRTWFVGLSSLNSYRKVTFWFQGADRLELATALMLGGLTPTVGEEYHRR